VKHDDPKLRTIGVDLVHARGIPKQTKNWKNAFKRTNGNRDYESLTFIRKTLENAFIGVFSNFLGIKTAKTPVFDRENTLLLNSRRKARFNGQTLEFSRQTS
jgi:hypothetical protein